MKRTYLTWVAIAILLGSLTAFAQPDTLWTRETGFVGDPVAIFEADDGGVLIVTGDEYVPEPPVKLLKLSAEGDSLWTRQIDLPLELDWCYGAEQYENGDLLLKLGTENELDTDRYLCRVTQEADVVWSLHHDFQRFVITPDSFVIDVRYGGAANDSQSTVPITKLTMDGDTIWSMLLVFDESYGYPFDVSIDSAQKILVVGTKLNWETNKYDGFAAILDSEGNLLWRQTYATQYYNWFFAGHFVHDGGVVIEVLQLEAGEVGTNLVKYDQYGNFQWSRHYLPEGQETGWAGYFAEAANGGLIGVGITDDLREPWLLRVDDNGEALWETCCWRPPIDRIWYIQFVECVAGGFFIAGSFERLGGPSYPHRILVTRLTPDPVNPSRPLPTTVEQLVLHPNYPNPFNPSTEITFDLPHLMQASLKVYDVLGREVAELVNGIMNAGAHTVTFDASALSSGVYFYRLDAGTFVETRKMVVMK